MGTGPLLEVWGFLVENPTIMNSSVAPLSDTEEASLHRIVLQGGQVWAEAVCTLDLKEEICARGEAMA